MDIQDLVSALHVVELSATGRSDVIRELVEALDWTHERVSAEEVVRAVEGREATAQTIVDEGLALPHAMIRWSGAYRVVLGRSRGGVHYGATGGKVHLVVLLVVGEGRVRLHLEVLSAVAELLGDRDLRAELVQARDVGDLRQILIARVGQQAQRRSEPTAVSPRSEAVIHQALGLAESLDAQAVLLAMDHRASVPWEPLIAWQGRLLIITSKDSAEVPRDRPDTHLFDIPHSGLSRMDRANLGLLLAAASGLIDHDREVVCITGPRGRAFDSITATKPSARFRAVFPEQQERSTTSNLPAVILRVLSLAIELAAEGREGHPIGVAFVLGDTRRVMRRSQQLVLNPFHGFARRLRNILDPSLAETVKEYALIDGAFVVEADGTIQSAGTYLIPRTHVAGLPSGLGARHQVAASITAETGAIAVAVSQSTGTVTLFQHGAVVLTLERATLTRW